jgi:hypothetical protein
MSVPTIRVVKSTERSPANMPEPAAFDHIGAD